ncbi:MAG TPA: DUF2914 domain-containing protein [Terriglobia bacterium]|nr:DUF2914 domain-containing protein [Terriglobia bacterium]
MLRILAVVVVIVVFAATGAAADLVSMKLCPTNDYDSAAKECAAGKSLEGNAIQIDLSKIGSLLFLTTVKTSKDEEIYHVWIFGKSSSKVMVYDSMTRMLREPEASELAWLKERNIDGAQVIVKLTASASEAYRLRSSKTLTPRMAGSWKVQVYDATRTKPLGEMAFTLGAADKGPID